jgi:hypothetical protein
VTSPLRGAANHWGRVIYEFLLARPTQEFRYQDLQDQFGLDPGSQFNGFISRTRQLAKQDGNCIAFCWDNGGALVLTCNPTDAQLAASIARRGKAIVGQTLNYLDQLEWGAANAADPILRRQCQRMVRAYIGATMVEEALGEMVDDLIERVGNPPSG